MALISISGHLFDSTGTPITNANVRFQLTNFGANIPTVTGTNVVVPTTVLLVTNSSGLYSGSIQGNDTITPTGTVYQVSFASSLTAQYIFTGSSPINLDSYPPATVIPVPTAPVPTNILTGNNVFTGVQTFSGENAAGNVALKSFASDAIQFVSANGNDSNDGLSWGSAKATIQAALTAAGSNGTVYVATGTPFDAAGITISLPVHLIFAPGNYVGYTGSTYAITVSYTDSGVCIEGSGQADVNHFTNGTCITVTNTAAGGINVENSPCGIYKNLTFSGPGSGTGIGGLLTGNQAQFIGLQAVYFGGVGLKWDGNRANSNNVYIRNCRAYDNGGIGIHIYGGAANNANSFTVMDCDAQDNTGINYQFEDSGNHNFFACDAESATDVVNYNFVSCSSCTGSLYSEPVSPFAAAAIAFDSLSALNNITLLNGRVVTDANFTNRWYFAQAIFTPPATAPAVSAPQVWNVGAGSGFLSALDIYRAYQGGQVLQVGRFFQSSSHISGGMLSAQDALNFRYNADGNGEVCSFWNASTDAQIPTATPVLQLNANGNATFGGSVSVGEFAANGVAPGAATTGYGTPTGNALTASFAASTITLPELAAELAQLILDLKATGLIKT